MTTGGRAGGFGGKNMDKDDDMTGKRTKIKKIIILWRIM